MLMKIQNRLIFKFHLILMANSYLSLICVLCIAFAHAADTQTLPIEPEKSYKIELAANVHSTYSLTIPEGFNQTNGENLYCSAYSLINDPYQQPIMKITSSSFTLLCESQQSDLNDICLIPNSQLNPGRKFTIDIYCEVDCLAEISVYFSKIFIISIGDEVKIKTDAAPIEKTFHIQIPTAEEDNNEFTEIQIMTDVLNIFDAKGGVEIYINYGVNPPIPTKSNHTQTFNKEWGRVKASIIRKNTFARGSVIAVTMVVGSNTDARLYTKLVNGNNRYLNLNQFYFDYVDSPNIERYYEIDLSQLKDTSKIVMIQLLEYSGTLSVEFSLDPKFNDSSKVKQAHLSWLKFDITPQMLQSATFKTNKKAYIKISSQSAATFILSAELSNKGFDILQPQLSVYVDIQPHTFKQYMIINYFKATDQQQIEEIRLQNFGVNNIKVSAFNCLKTLDKCLLSSFEQLQQLQKGSNSSEISALNTEVTKKYVRLLFNPESCTRTKSQDYYQCKHLIIATAQNKSASAAYGLTLSDNISIISLREGQSLNTNVDIEKYRYFSFILPQDTTSNITQMIIYLNLLDGKASLIASPSIIKPTLEDTGKSSIKTGTSIIKYNTSEISPGTYYITVYGHEWSEFIINIIVRRNTNKNTSNSIWRDPTQQASTVEITNIELIEGVTQLYELQKGNERINFKFAAKSTGTVKIKVSELVGRVSFTVVNFMDASKVQCSSICEFGVKEAQIYVVAIIGDINGYQKFTIVFNQLGKCYEYPIGVPLYGQLNANEMDCLRVVNDRVKPLELSSSLTPVQILNRQVIVSIDFPSNNSITLLSNSYIIDSKLLQQNCPTDQCQIIFNFQAGEKPALFQTIIQRIDGVINMYDGVTQKISASMSKTKAKYFKYALHSKQSVKIFLQSQTYTQYEIIATIINESQLKNSAQNYPNQSNSKAWKIKSSLQSPALTVLTISKDKIDKFIKDNKIRQPQLTVSVFTLAQSEEKVAFTLEMTQSQRVLKEGQSSIGFLQPNEVVSYEVYPSKNSLLSIRSLLTEKCYTLMTEQMKAIKGSAYIDEIHLQNSPKTPVYYYMKSSNHNCMYQISLQNYQNFLISVTEGFPHFVSLEYGEISYLLYFHNRNTTFRVIEMLYTGDSKVYATPLTEQMMHDGVLKNIKAKLPLDNFKYEGKEEKYLEIQARAEGDYCFNCYYLIAVKGDPSVQQEILIVNKGLPIILKQHSTMDAELKAGETESYLFYTQSNQQIKLSVNIVHGSADIKVTDLSDFSSNGSGKVILSTNLKPSSQSLITINKHENATPNVLNYVYKFEMSSLQSTFYFLQISRSKSDLKLSEGLPMKVEFAPKQTFNLLFDSIDEHEKIYLTIQGKLLASLSIVIKFYNYDGFNKKFEPVTFAKSYSGQSLVYFIDAKRGHYVMEVTNMDTSKVNAVVLIPRQELTMLLQSHTTVMKHEAIFKIFIPEAKYAMIEVFNCKGNVRARGSTNYSEITTAEFGPNQIELLHENVGGHYVINTKGIQGPYYIRIQTKQYSINIKDIDAELEYMIRYKLFSEQSPNPYQLVDISDYKIVKEESHRKNNITFEINNVKPISSKIKITHLRYNFAIGLGADEVRKYLICSTSSNTQSLSRAFEADPKQQKVYINVSKNTVMQKIGNEVSYVGVLASASVENEDTGEIMEDVVFIYEPVEMNKYQYKRVITPIGFFSIIVIILVSMSCIAVLYLLFTEMMKIYRGYQQSLGSDLVEQNSDNVGVDVSSMEESQHVEKQEKGETNQQLN